MLAGRTFFAVFSRNRKIKSESAQIGDQVLELAPGKTAAIRVTRGIEYFAQGTGGNIVKKAVALAHAEQRGRIEFLESGLVMEADVVFVR